MHSRFLIVTNNMVMAEDLRELLGSGNDVDVVRSIEEPWSGRYDVAFFGDAMAVLLKNPRVVTLGNDGTRIVVFNGVTNFGSDTPMNIASLSLPFTSEDILRLFEGFGMPLKLPPA